MEGLLGCTDEPLVSTDLEINPSSRTSDWKTHALDLATELCRARASAFAARTTFPTHGGSCCIGVSLFELSPFSNERMGLSYSNLGQLILRWTMPMVSIQLWTWGGRLGLGVTCNPLHCWAVATSQLASQFSVLA
eukprot:11036360-Lingulodinium_polyedra.AAC.1